MDDKKLEQLRKELNVDNEGKETNLSKDAMTEDNKKKFDELTNGDNESNFHEEIDSLYYGAGGSEVSKSQMSNKTIISKLETELQVEREARKRLEKEIEEIKKISSEISSHLAARKNN
jgi:hypothetical protein